MLRDGKRCLGSHKVVAGVMAVSTHLTQDAGWTHAACGSGKENKLFLLICDLLSLAFSESLGYKGRKNPKK